MIYIERKDFVFRIGEGEGEDVFLYLETLNSDVDTILDFINLTIDLKPGISMEEARKVKEIFNEYVSGIYLEDE